MYISLKYCTFNCHLYHLNTKEHKFKEDIFETGVIYIDIKDIHNRTQASEFGITLYLVFSDINTTVPVSTYFKRSARLSNKKHNRCPCGFRSS